MSQLRVSSIASNAGTQSVTQDRLYRGAATAWCNWNGTGTVAIRDSYNVSSITDNGTGDYTVNFTTALANANYVACGSRSKGDANNDGNAGVQCGGWSGNLQTASACRVRTVSFAEASASDAELAMVCFFGGY